MEKVCLQAEVRGQAGLSRRCRQYLNLKDKQFVERPHYAAIVVHASNGIKDGERMDASWQMPEVKVIGRSL